MTFKVDCAKFGSNNFYNLNQNSINMDTKSSKNSQAAYEVDVGLVPRPPGVIPSQRQTNRTKTMNNYYINQLNS